MPDWKNEIAQRLSSLKLSPVREAEIIEELSAHLDDRYRELERSGQAPADALRTALDELEGNELLAAELRPVERRQSSLMEPDAGRAGKSTLFGGFIQDFRYSLRSLRRNPTFTAAAVITLALGIGANTSIFSVINAVLLRPLPYPSPDRLVMIFESRPKEGVLNNNVSPADFSDWKMRQRVFENVSAEIVSPSDLVGAGEPMKLVSGRVSSTYFKVSGLTPILGRDFREHEDRGVNGVVILNRGLWEGRFGGDPAIIGRKVTLNGEPFEIVGVVSHPQSPIQLWFPFDFTSEEMLARTNHFLNVYGRLKPESTIEIAQKDMDRISDELWKEVEQQNQGHRAHVISLREQLVGDLRPSLAVLAAAVGMVLLIACANVANLLLARGASRERELAIRFALGAGRFRIFRQYLLECMWLGLLAAAAGVPIAVFATRSLIAIAPVDIPLLTGARLDFVVLGYMVALAVVTALVSGLIPMLQAGLTDPNAAMKETSLLGGSLRRRLRNGLIVSEIALSFVLLSASGLMMRSLWNLLHVPSGFDATNVVTVPISLSRAQLEKRPPSVFFPDLVERIRGLDGVVGVGLTSFLPMGGNDSRTGMQVEGRERDPNEPTRAHPRYVSPEYFQTMRMRLTDGRFPANTDLRKGFPLVVVINRAAALKYWPGQNPVGKRIRMLGPEWREIIGVIDDVKFWGLSSPVNPEVYLPVMRTPTILVARTQGNITDLVAGIRNHVRQLDPDLPLSDIRTMEDVIAKSVARSRFYLILLSAFGLVAVILTAAGIYGVISYTVAQMTREIGVRMALGAQPSSVLRSVLRQGLLLTILSLVLGIAASIGLTRLMGSLLFGVSGSDPSILAVTALVVIGISLLACYAPARRASKVDPIVALRHQ